jgi:hypothetical protein
MFRSALPDVLQYLPDHLTTHTLLCCSPAIRADMRNDIRLNGSDLTMALARASYWERRAKNTHQSVVKGLRRMNDDLEAARGTRIIGADRESLNEIIVSNGNVIYHSLFNSQKPDLFAEEAEEEEEEVMEEMPVCSVCALHAASRVGLRVLGAPVCGVCFATDLRVRLLGR